MIPLAQHQNEIQENLAAWQTKPLLQQIYRDFYQRIIPLIDRNIPGRIVEIGSGLGNLKQYFPDSLATDLFPNPWLDLVCDGYELPFRDRSLSHLVLFDVFHHLETPKAFLSEAQRVLAPNGRLLLFEPFISWTSHCVYGLLHHEPVGWRQPIAEGAQAARPRDYYAAQGNATRVFFRSESSRWLSGWKLFHAQAFSAFSYLLSGGYSKPACYGLRQWPWLRKLDQELSRWPRLFGARCLVGLSLDPTCLRLAPR